MISADPYFCIAGAFLLMLLPLDWIISAATAALVHELCHMAAVILFGGKIRGIRISLTGCRIEAAPLGKRKRILCILAGPAGSILLFLLRRKVPRIAVCGLLQGIYNLLPVLPLDGGRLLRELLYLICPAKAENIMYLIRLLTAVGVSAGFILVGIRFQLDLFSIIFCLLIHIGIHRRKIPCKENRIGLQWY